MISQMRKYLWDHFYARFFVILVSQHPQMLNERFLRELKMFFQVAPIKEIEDFIATYLGSNTLDKKYGEEIFSSPYTVDNNLKNYSAKISSQTLD
ncbi:MAG: hypothetical protein ACRCY4_00975 [Brevinema sp.]